MNGQETLIQELKKMGIKNEEVLNAMNNIPQEEFTSQSLLRDLKHYLLPYAIDTNEIEYAVSNPFLVALMTELLEVEKGMKILEIGTGSGYQAAVLSYLGCDVYTTERIYYLFLEAKKRFKSLKLPVNVFYQDGTNGLREHAYYDRIVVTASMPHYPITLEKQINQASGIIIVPIGNAVEPQRLYRIVFKNGMKSIEKGIYSNFSLIQTGISSFVFVPEKEKAEMFYN